jgi:hypothetical protein
MIMPYISWRKTSIYFIPFLVKSHDHHKPWSIFNTEQTQNKKESYYPFG